MKIITTVATAACTLLVASFVLRAQEPAQQPQPPAGRGERGGQPPAAPGPAAKPLVPVAASTLAKHPEPYYGERVSLTGAVEASVGKLAFSVDQDKTKTMEQQVLVVVPRLNAPIDGLRDQRHQHVRHRSRAAAAAADDG